MNRRLRFLAALLALFALSAYIGESVWASMCPPGIGGHVAIVDDVSDDGAHAGVHHGPAPSSEDSDSSRSHGPACPLGMTGAGSSCVAVSLPAVATTMAHGGKTYAVTPLFRDATHDRLLVVPHFRPPRA